ncbi:MAG: hypothetical protein ACYC5G_01225 [Candidatus Doudnabacteria bacterium]
MMEREKEYILCAANYYNDDKTHSYSPKNIYKGFVICGRRHHNCIEQFAMMVGFPYTPEGMKLHQTEKQGFLTNADRFVDRVEASEIAFESGQTKEKQTRLFSEDLY